MIKEILEKLPINDRISMMGALGYSENQYQKDAVDLFKKPKEEKYFKSVFEDFIVGRTSPYNPMHMNPGGKALFGKKVAEKGREIKKNYGLLFQLGYLRFVDQFMKEHKNRTGKIPGTVEEFYPYALKRYLKSIWYWVERGYNNKLNE